MNNISLIATLTKDPGLAASAQLKICDLRVMQSVSERRGDQRLYIDVETYGRSAEVCAHYLHKGRMVAVQGQLRTEQRGTPDAPNMRYYIAAERVDFLTSPQTAQDAEAKS